jgi:tuftelin-interacting protein 11
MSKEHFRKALEMMNRAVSIPQGLQPGSVEQVSYLTTLERSQSQIPQISQISQPRMEVCILVYLLLLIYV